ncbi:MAG: methyltransferase domain-containing protein [Candidatus Micrarchaeaceae archaeon]
MRKMFIYPKIYKKLKRGPQVILPKDIGIIISYTGVNKDSVCIDAGTGSGWLAVSLGLIAKQVYSYDIREEFSKIAEKNVSLLNLKNVSLKIGDITKGIVEKDVDIFTLDLPNSEKALKTVKKALKPEGCVVAYIPHAEQVIKYSKKLSSLGFEEPYVIECIVRDILVRKEGMRPSTKGIWHTAYLVFSRKPVKKEI